MSERVIPALRIVGFVVMVVFGAAYIHKALTGDPGPSPGAPSVEQRSPLPLPQLPPPERVDPVPAPAAAKPAAEPEKAAPARPSKRKKIARTKSGKPATRVVKKRSTRNADATLGLVWPGDRPR